MNNMILPQGDSPQGVSPSTIDGFLESLRSTAKEGIQLMALVQVQAEEGGGLPPSTLKAVRSFAVYLAMVDRMLDGVSAADLVSGTAQLGPFGLN